MSYVNGFIPSRSPLKVATFLITVVWRHRWRSLKREAFILTWICNDAILHDGKGMEARAVWRPDQIHFNRSLYWACYYHGGLASNDCSGSEPEPQCSRPSEQPMPVSRVTYEKAPLLSKRVLPAVKQLFKQISLWDPFTFKPKWMIILK